MSILSQINKIIAKRGGCYTVLIDPDKKNIDLIAFPELFITGYNLKDNYNSVSEKIPSKGPAQEGIYALAKKHVEVYLG